jgi:hypothetical protein
LSLSVTAARPTALGGLPRTVSGLASTGAIGAAVVALHGLRGIGLLGPMTLAGVLGIIVAPPATTNGGSCVRGLTGSPRDAAA